MGGFLYHTLPCLLGFSIPGDMSSTPDMPPATGGGPDRHRHKRQLKNLKAREGRLNYVVGRDVYIDRVGELCSRALVGRLEYATLDKKQWFDWALEQWKPLIHYVPVISLLVKGWIVFVFLNEEHATTILNRPWRIGKGSLVLDRWNVQFDPARTRIKKRHLWALLPGLPFPLWNRDTLEGIGNSIGRFIAIEEEFLNTFDKRMARILVEIDVSMGLPADIDILCDQRVIPQRIDYQGVPFRCSLCRDIGHLRRRCPALRSSRSPRPFSSLSGGSTPSVVREHDEVGPSSIIPMTSFDKEKDACYLFDDAYESEIAYLDSFASGSTSVVLPALCIPSGGFEETQVDVPSVSGCNPLLPPLHSPDPSEPTLNPLVPPAVVDTLCSALSAATTSCVPVMDIPASSLTTPLLANPHSTPSPSRGDPNPLISPHNALATTPPDPVDEPDPPLFSLSDFPPLNPSIPLVTSHPLSPVDCPSFSDPSLQKSLDIFSDKTPISPSVLPLDSIRFENVTIRRKKKNKHIPSSRIIEPPDAPHTPLSTRLKNAARKHASTTPRVLRAQTPPPSAS